MSKIYTCSECEATPKLSLIHKEEKDIIISDCVKCKKKQELDIKDFLENNFKEYNPSIMKCGVCELESSDTKKNFLFCRNCKIFLCTERKNTCSLEHQEENNCPEKGHTLILQKNIPLFCQEHYEICKNYCNICKKKICEGCLNDHKDHQIKKISDNLVDNDFLDNLIAKRKYQKLKLKLLKNIFDEIDGELSDYMEKLQKKFELFLEMNETELKLSKKLINSYKAQSGMNYELKENLLNLANIKEINLNLEKLMSRKSNPLERLYYIDKLVTEKFFFISEIKKIENDITNNIQNCYNTLNFHKYNIEHLTLLKDGRLSSCSSDKSIIIYSKEFIPVIKIEDDQEIYFHTQLKNGHILSTNYKGIMKIIKLKEYSYDIIQVLTDHENSIKKVLEMKNGKLISCSRDGTLKIWKKDFDKYSCERTIEICDDIYTMNMIFINDNEIALSVDMLNTINFMDINDDFKIKNKIENIELSLSNDSMCITKEGILIVGTDIGGGIYLIDAIKHVLIAKIYENMHHIKAIIQLKNGNILIGGAITNEDGKKYYELFLFKYENNNLKEIEKNEEAHDDTIDCLLEMEDGTIVSGSADKTIKLWG